MFSAITELGSQNRICIETHSPIRWSTFIFTESKIWYSSHSTKLWKLRTVPKCHLWNNPWPTIQHILNGCPVTLSQGRYTWQHDKGLKTFVSSRMKQFQPQKSSMLTLRVTENWPSTARILNTSACQDVVIIRSKEIAITELTVVYNSPNCLYNARLKVRARNYTNSQPVIICFNVYFLLLCTALLA